MRGGEVGCGDCWDVKGEFFTATNNERAEGSRSVHDVELGDAGDEVIVKSEEDIAFLEGLGGIVDWRCRGSTVDFTDHEELVARRVCFGNSLDPRLGDTHDTDLGHLYRIGFNVEDAKIWDDTSADLIYDG